MKSYTTSRFRKSYARLPEAVRKAAKKQFRLWLADITHPSLQYKRVGLFWSARVTDDYRALCYHKDGTHYWFWIGKHAEYERILKG